MSDKLETTSGDTPASIQAVITPSPTVKETPQAKEAQQNTQKKLVELRKEIQEKGMSFDLTKSFLENLDKIESPNRPFILGGIFSGLNHIGISLSGIGQDGKIVLHPPKIPFKAEGNFATHEDTLRYNELFNHYIRSGKVSISDISKGLLYRTSSVDDYIKEKADNSFSTPEYVQRLLKKYKIHVEGNIKDISFGSGIEGKKQFEAFKKDISFAISDNQADKEFLLAYFDDVYYRGGKSLSSDEITAYTQKSAENQKKVLSEISHLNDEQKFALGIRDSNEAKELSRDITKDPIGFLKKNMTADNISLAIIFGIIGAFLGGKKGFGIGAILGFGVGAGGLAFAQEGWNKLGEKKDQKGNKTPEQRVLTANPKENHLSSKVTFTKETDTAKRGELEKIWGELSQNEKFLGAQTPILSIFEDTRKTFEEIKTALGAYGIKLTNENKEYYKIIFAEIIKQRKNAIGEAKENETIKDYLERTSKIETAVATGVVGVNAPEKITERFQVSGYSENGRNYIIGPDGNPKLIEYSQLSPEFQRQIERLNTSGKVVNNFLMILTTLSKKEPKFNSYIIELQQKIEKIDISKKDDIENLLKWIYESKDTINTSLNNENDAQTHPWTLNIDLSKDEEVLKLIRKIDSESAKKLLIEKLFSLTGISDTALNDFITNPTGSHTKIQKLLGEKEYNNLAIEVSKKKSEADKYFIENRENFKNQIKTQNNNISDNEVNKILDEKYKPMITGSFVYSFAKNELLETFLVKNTEKNWLGEYNGDNELLKLYGDIVGVGWGNMSDKSLDWGKEAFLLIGTEIIAIGAGALTMGAGFYAVNAAVWGARGYRGIKALQLSAEAGKIARLGRWGAMSVVEGGSFYLGYGGAQSMIEGENMYSKEGLMHSIAFAGAFRALRAIPGLQLKPEVALSEQKLRITSVLAADTAVLGGIGLGFDGVLFEPGEWTAEHFIQAFAMAIMFRGMTHAGEKINLKFRKNGERVEVSKNPIENNYFNKSAQESAHVFEQFFGKKESLIKSILPKKPGEEIKIGDKAIKKTIEGKFEYNGAKYDKADDIIPVLSRELKDSQIISKINEGGTKNLNKLFAGIDKKEIKIGDDIFRFRIEGKNKILEIKNGNSWTTKSIDELSDGQAQILLDKILGSGIKEKIIGSAREKLESIKINNIISTTERDTIIKRFGKGAWEKISKEFDDFMTKIPSKSDGKSHIYGAERFKEKGFGNAISGLLIGFKEGTWKTMLGGVVTNEIWETYQAGGISQRYENYDIYTDGIDTIMNGILFKKVSLGRAIIAQTIFESTLGNN